MSQANFLPAKLSGNQWETEIGSFRVAVLPTEQPSAAELMLREEELDLVPHDESSVVVRERQFLGREYRYCLQTDSGKYLHARTGIQTMVPVGSRVEVKVQTTKPHFFLAS